MELAEKTGDKFRLETFFEARRLCKVVASRIASKVESGMAEADGQTLIKDEFKKEGIAKFWHPSKFRIGSDTTKTFRDLPDQSIRLESGDIYFLDVGPIFEEHEADYGETFVFHRGGAESDERLDLAGAAIRIWKDTAKSWKETRLSGKSLLDCASARAQDCGYKLNPLMAGHRLGDFPHALFSKDRLFESDVVPSANLWVLEIHVVSERLQRGAFFEDLLF